MAGGVFHQQASLGEPAKDSLKSKPLLSFGSKLLGEMAKIDAAPRLGGYILDQFVRLHDSSLSGGAGHLKRVSRVTGPKRVEGMAEAGRQLAGAPATGGSCSGYWFNRGTVQGGKWGTGARPAPACYRAGREGTGRRALRIAR